RYVLAIVAEGTQMSDYLTRWINDSIQMEARLTVLGHVQRGGSPTVRDRLMAHKFAVGAIDALDAGKTNAIMVYRDGDYGDLPIQEVCDSKYELDPKLLRMCADLSK
ncbi:MAG: 6-phosphofructokinase, partial [Haloferula sp.]